MGATEGTRRAGVARIGFAAIALAGVAAVFVNLGLFPSLGHAPLWLVRATVLVIGWAFTRDETIRLWLRTPAICYCTLYVLLQSYVWLRWEMLEYLALLLPAASIAIPAVSALRSPSRRMAMPWLVYAGVTLMQTLPAYLASGPYTYGARALGWTFSWYGFAVITLAGYWAVYRTLPHELPA